MTTEAVYRILMQEKEKQRLTYREIGEMAGYDPRGLYRIINGEANPRAQTVFDLVEAMGFELVLMRKRGTKHGVLSGKPVKAEKTAD